MNLHEDILKRIDAVPQSPGCYLWKNNSEVIYVGKAKNLKKRMRDYFYSKNHSPKNLLLISRIDDFEIILTNSETESLLLEKNLIDNYKPRYNIKIKHSQGYPYLKISGKHTKEIKIVNTFKKDGSIYYGPFPSGMSSSTFKRLLLSLFPFNDCKNKGGNKPCINYQLGLCIGHCIKKVNESDYEVYIKEIDNFFKKSTTQIRKLLKDKVDRHSSNLQFEQASELNKLVEVIDSYDNYQKIHIKNIEDSDYIAWYEKEGFISITIANYRYGKLINIENHIYESYGNTHELVEYFIYNYYFDKMNTIPIYLYQEIISNSDYNFKFAKQGNRKKIIELAKKNAVEFYEQNLQRYKNKLKVEQKVNNWINEKLNLDSRKYYELADISTMQNELSTGVVVAFNNRQRDTSKYRRYNFEGIQNNDHRYIYELVYRHFNNKINNSEVLPSLFIVDGGISQLRAAKRALSDLDSKFDKVISLIKNHRHKTEKILTFEEKIIELDNRDVMNLFEHMQNEVHRFAIESFRKYVKK